MFEPSGEKVKRAPKVLLHDHLDGGLRPQTVIDLAPEGHELPSTDADGLRRWFEDSANSGSLERYLQTFDHTVAVMQTPRALERIAYEFVTDAAKENIRYVEVRYCPALHTPALTLTQAVESPLEGIGRAAAETGVRVGLIVCGSNIDAATFVKHVGQQL